MTLSEILIAAGVTPDDLHPDCRFIAQDKYDGLTVEYKKFPEKLTRNAWSVHGFIRGGLSVKLEVSLDRKKPLSREQFTADYAAHQAAKQ